MNRYIIIPDKLKVDSSVIPSAKLLYGDIVLLTNKQGYCFATNRYFGKVYGVGVSSITKWVKSLKDSGYIKIKYFKNKSISNREIYITQKCEGYSKNMTDPLSQKSQHNNTSYNNQNKRKVKVMI